MIILGTDPFTFTFTTPSPPAGGLPGNEGLRAGRDETLRALRKSFSAAAIAPRNQRRTAPFQVTPSAAPLTTLAGNENTAPGNVTVPLASVAAPPACVTPPPDDMTITPAYVTSSPGDVTPVPGHVTALRRYVTLPLDDVTSSLGYVAPPLRPVTSPLGDMTLPPVAVTAPPGYLSAPRGDVTGPLGNVTSHPVIGRVLPIIPMLPAGAGTLRDPFTAAGVPAPETVCQLVQALVFRRSRREEAHSSFVSRPWISFSSRRLLLFQAARHSACPDAIAQYHPAARPCPTSIPYFTASMSRCSSSLTG